MAECSPKGWKTLWENSGFKWLEMQAHKNKGLFGGRGK